MFSQETRPSYINMNDSDLGELLKAAKDVPLLNAGINNGIVVSTYPV
jgi:hypothetical protein